jgi:two-component system, response regulator
MQFLRELIFPGGFMPHGYCYLWTPDLIGLHVSVARDREEALDFVFCLGDYEGAACQPLPQLILLDLKLPKVDGISVLRKIQADRRTRSIPVIVLTSSGEDRDLQATCELGVNNYIRKPLDFDRFRETVDTLGRYWLHMNLPPPREPSHSGEPG